jgi:hypothetical protein
MFGHATLQPGIAATIFPRTQTSVTANAASITEAMPVAYLPVDYHAGKSAKAAWLLGIGRRLQLCGQSADLSCKARRIGCMLESNSFIHSGTRSWAKLRAFHQLLIGSIP